MTPGKIKSYEAAFNRIIEKYPDKIHTIETLVRVAALGYIEPIFQEFLALAYDDIQKKCKLHSILMVNQRESRFKRDKVTHKKIPIKPKSGASNVSRR